MNLLRILGNIGFDWRVALFNFINFLIVFWLLKRFVFGPVKNVLRERQEKIDKGLEDAKKADTALLMAKENADQTVGAARLEANQIVAEAGERGKKVFIGIEEKAKLEAADIRERAEQALAKERTLMQKQIQEQSAALVVEGVKRILKQEIDEKKGEAIIKDLIRQK
jgi:F-type H+-transporting ATPase subunit b